MTHIQTRTGHHSPVRVFVFVAQQGCRPMADMAGSRKTIRHNQRQADKTDPANCRSICLTKETQTFNFDSIMTIFGDDADFLFGAIACHAPCPPVIIVWGGSSTEISSVFCINDTKMRISCCLSRDKTYSFTPNPAEPPIDGFPEIYTR